MKHLTKSRGIRSAILAFTLALPPLASAQAHEIWFAQRSGALALVYGLGADDLDMVKRQHLITAVAGYDAALRPVRTSMHISGPMLLVTSAQPVSVVTAIMDNGAWARDRTGEWQRQGKTRLPNTSEAEKTIKYAVAIEAMPRAPLPALPGMELQIVPTAASLPTHEGDPMLLRVLHNGKPLAGARVLPNFVDDPDATPLSSRADGTVAIHVANQGLNVVAAAIDLPSQDPSIDRIEVSATLSFVLPHKPE